MTPSIPQGTVLRQRYLIRQILGQGGFGRTYLAIDLERFKEPCVLKELTVPYQNRALWEKSQMLFQREASTLYQIQHAQIPRFWASFEDNHRLFLVQDFVRGKSYRHLLQVRQRQGRNFSPNEVLHLLHQLLPVLSYIHERKIVHRDISPENIMLQMPGKNSNADASVEVPRLPVLIDFGAVKAAVTAYCGASLSSSLMTCIGKAGYAPPEQLQTGKAYPHSDLYALAATCLVLLTGQEPQTLLDSQTLTWQWQQYTSLNDRFAAILHKMLAWQPSDRYQNAQEVLIDLQSLLSSAQTRWQPDAPPAPTPSMRIATPPVTSTLLYPPTPELKTPTQLTAPSEQNLWAKLGIATSIGLVVATGLVVPHLWRPWITPQTAHSEQSALSSNLLDEPTRSSWSLSKSHTLGGSPASTSSMAQPQRLEFLPGQNVAIARGTLQEYTLQPYILKADQGQIVTVTLEGSGVVMNLLNSHQQGIDAAAYQTRSWTGQIPADDHYLIQILGTGSYALEVAMTPVSRTLEAPTQRIKLARGTTGTTVTGNLSPNKMQRYLIQARGKQIMVVKVLQGEAQVSIISPTGDRIGGSSGESPDWQGQLPVDGDYAIEVSSEQISEFALALDIY
ncbi:MAG: serine/threonine protein kinase [Desertifilum sp. SIO1I2]|nr:serine/threonine protein kinase [Desertifilum sp. SIO1I2]